MHGIEEEPCDAANKTHIAASICSLEDPLMGLQKDEIMTVRLCQTLVGSSSTRFVRSFVCSLARHLKEASFSLSLVQSRSFIRSLVQSRAFTRSCAAAYKVCGEI